MPISIEADPTLAQGYLKVNGVTAATVTSTGLTTASLQNAAVTPAKLSQPYTLATAQNSTSGTSIDFTGIPSWVRRITVMFSGVSTNGTSNLQIQIGAGSVTSSGYNSSAWTATAQVTGNVTTGFILTAVNVAATTYHGSISITTLGSNVWACSHSIGGQPSNYQSLGGGSISLGGTLDRVRVTTVNGTDTFDAGTINIAYEG